jgi:hypothetical protein
MIQRIPGFIRRFGSAARFNVGTAASNIIQLNSAAKLPAVDGSLLTNLPAGASGWTQLAAGSAAGASSIADTTHFSATYRQYVWVFSSLYITNLIYATINGTQNAGSTWTTNGWIIKSKEFTLGGSTITDASNSGQAGPIVFDHSTVGGGTNFALTGIVWIEDPAGTTRYKNVWSEFWGRNGNGDNYMRWAHGIYNTDTNAFNGYRLALSSGTWSSGYYALFGIQS